MEVLNFNPTLPQGQVGVVGERSRKQAGIIAIVLGVCCYPFGIHNFMLGYTTKAVVQLIWSIVNFLILFIPGVGWIIKIPLMLLLSTWAIVDGIFILTNKEYIDADGNLLRD